MDDELILFVDTESHNVFGFQEKVVAPCVIRVAMRRDDEVNFGHTELPQF